MERTRRIFSGLLALSALLWSGHALAQGDNCATAVAIVPGVGIAGNGPATGGGASNPICPTGIGENPGGIPANADWFSYTATATGTARLTVTAGVDTRVAIHTGTCGSLTCYAGDDDISGANFLSAVMFPVYSGTTYYIEFDDGWDPGAYVFTLTQTAHSAASPVTIAAFPYTQSFAAPNSGSTCATILAEPAGAGAGWINHTDEGADWLRRTATTPSTGSGTGPNNGFTGAAGDYYLYLETSQGTCAPAGYYAMLTSPIFDKSTMVGTGDAQVSWYDHMFGATQGRMIVQYEFPAGTGNWTTISSKNGNLGNQWNFNPFTTLAGVTTTFRVRWLGWRDSGTNSFTGDMAIDQIVVRERPDCTPPVATAAVVENCQATAALSDFTVAVTVSDLGTLGGVPQTQATIVPSSGPSQVANALGVYNFGPYAFGTVVSFTLTHQSEPACNSFIPGTYRSCCSSQCTTAFTAAIGTNANTNAAMNICFGGATNAFASGAPVPTAARWWTFSPLVSGVYTLGACDQAPVTNTDTRVSVHTGTCAGLTLIGGDDDGCTTPTFGSLLSIGLFAGTTYYIEWDNAWNTAGHTWSLTGPTPFLPGDQCITALPLTMSPTCVNTLASTAGMTQETPSCAAGVGATTNADMWFSFTATSSLAQIDVTPVGTYYPILELLDASGGCVAPTSLCCTFSGAGAGTPLTLLRGGLTVGNSYFLRVGHAFGGGDGGLNQFNICVYDGTAPTPGCSPIITPDYTESEPCGTLTNSDLCTAEPIVLGALPFTFDIAGTIQAECNFRDRDFYVFTLASTGTYQVDFTGQFASRIFFLDANGLCSDPLVQINTAGAAACATGTITQSLAPGTYALMMTTDGIFNNITCGTVNDYQMTITAVPNLDCSLATPITCGVSNGVGLSGSGLWSITSCGFTTPGNEAVYELNAAVAGNYNLTVTASNGNFIDYFYKPVSDGCTPANWNCIQDIAAAGTSVNFNIPAPGLYWILADAEDDAVTSTQTFRIFCPPAAVSTDFCTPIAVNCGDNVSGQTNAIPGVFPPTACPFTGPPSTGGANFWSFTSATDADVTVSMCGSASYDTRVSIYLLNPDCNNLLCVAKNDDGAGCPAFSSEVRFPATGGANYLIAVSGFGGDFGYYLMSVFCGPACLPAVSNDLCSFAAPLTPALDDGSGVATPGDNTCAYGDENTSCDQFGVMQGMWYAFNSGPNSIMFMDLLTNAQSGGLSASLMNYALYDGGCSGLGALNELNCVLDGDGADLTLPALTPSTNYLLYVWNDGAGASQDGTFSVLLRRPGMNDAGIDTILDPNGSLCTTDIVPRVVLRNHGEAPLTSVDVVYDVDGLGTLTYNWTGNLAYQETDTFNLPTISTTQGPHTLNATTDQPNGAADEIPANDAAAKSLNITGESAIVSIVTDNNGGQLSWTIFDAFLFPVANSPSYAGQNNETVNTEVCLPTSFGSCYYFFLFDTGGDGLCCLNGSGSWKLITLNGRTILGDLFANTPDGGQSPALSPATAGYFAHEFCLPVGPSNILSSECNIFTNTLLSKVYTAAVAGVTNYQFEFTNPDAGFRRRIGVPRNWVQFSEIVTNPLTPGTVYFARARADQGASGYADDHFGTGCEMAINPAGLGCTQLIDNISLPTHSCGVTKAFGGSDKVWAQPVVGATQYRFRFQNVGEGYLRNILRPSYVCLLSWVTNPLVNGSTYDVTVETFVSGVWSGYCGATCSVTILNPPAQQGRVAEVSNMEGLELYPNPVSDGRVNLRINGLVDAEQAISVDVYDTYGKRVMTQQYRNSGDLFNTVLELEAGMARGMYLVNITVNGTITTRRLSVM